MADIYIPPTDLRRSATEAKRFHDKKAKWAYGTRFSRYTSSPPQSEQPRCGSVRDCFAEKHVVEQYPHLVRPALPDTHNMKEHNLNFLARGAKIALRQDVREILNDKDSSDSDSDSSSVDEVHEPTGRVIAENDAAGVDDGAGVPLPYEESGHTILCDAVDKAVEKFETKETEKLVREYEVVGSEDGETGVGYSVDGFEMVEYV